MKKLIPIAVVAVLAMGAAFFWGGTQTSPSSTNLSLPGAAVAQEASEDVDTSMVHEMVLGAEDAPVTMIEYASSTCPHCKNFHLGSFKQLKSDYIDTGKVRFIYREVYFDRFGLWAAMVARCGMPVDANAPEMETASKRYFAIMDMVFEQQSEWLEGEGPADIAENLAKFGRTAGLGAEQVDACLQDADFARALIAVYEENRAADGVQSTPTFIINGEKVTGNQPYAALSELIEAGL
ncbi:MAG: DsbA family protein [Pseudomonadota bacterium]